MDDELYAIGDVARRTGLSVSAIRYYADAGVIAPSGRTAAGYRLYDIGAIARLELVRTLRELGAGLDDIRRLLAGEMALGDLATAHLALVDGQMRRLRARRAVLRTIAEQHTATEQVGLMHKLVSMSDDDRDQLVDGFWNEISDGLDVHPSYVEQLRAWRPKLPEEPSAEQLEAWIELADLVRDWEFRRSVRHFFHNAFSHGARARHVTTPAVQRLIETQAKALQEADEAQRFGLAPESPQAQDIAARLLASIAELEAELSGEPVRERDDAEIREWVLAMGRADPRGEAVEDAVSGFQDMFQGLFGRYMSLVSTINGTPQEDPEGADAAWEWFTTAVAASPRGEEAGEAEGEGEERVAR
ncbi:MerR family transcriptional regulator [Streptomyces sp. NPDC127033]|uniref:helix-turn-helix domain-containing protein n=1 Tax=Streptomyces sp. NPDC127033 TaxID=3347110 RepID=UPI003646E0D3